VSLYAFDAIDDAFSATRSFLWPFEIGRWARLALVVFFLGGAGGGFNPSGFNVPSSTGGGPGGPGDPTIGAPSIGAPELAIIAAVAGVILAIVLLFMLVGSIMEFVFVESLRREEVHVRQYWGERWGQGLRLLAFRVVLGVLTPGVFAGLLVAALAPLIFDSGGLSIPLVVFAVLVGIVVALASGIINGFTTVFVVPVMIAEEIGVLAAWRRFWGTLTGQWTQYGAYLVMGFILQIAAGLLAGIGTLLIAVGLAIPFGIVALVGAGLLSVSSIAGWIVIGIAALLFVLSMIAVVLLVGVPIQTFLRYYALFVLGDTNDDFDLIAERRAAIRGDGADG
jgi:hypothetical protein